MRDRRSRMLVVSGVLIALALGIVLGSGPLRATLTGTSGVAVAEANDARDQARAEAERARAEADAALEYSDAATTLALAGAFDDRTLAIVRVGGVGDEAVDAATARIVDGGADVGADVTVGADWTSDERRAFRDALAEQLAASIDDPPEGATTDQLLARALAQSLAPEIASGTDLVGTAAQERADTLWTILADGGLVSGERSASAEVVVLVAADPAAVTSLASALREYSNATVVAFAGEADPVAVGDASSVTDADTFFGGIAVAFAMLEQIAGGQGAYAASDAPVLLASVAR